MTTEGKERRLKFLDSRPVDIISSLRVRVNYKLDFSSLVRRSEKHLDYISEGILQMQVDDIFKGLHDVTVEFAVFDYKYENFYFPWEAQRVLKRINLRPANIREVLAIATQHRRVVEKQLAPIGIFCTGIPAFGSIAQDSTGKKYVIAISCYGYDCSLDKRVLEGSWPAYCLFPGVKIS